MILEGKRPFCVFEPPLGDLWATYDDHLRLVGKHVRDFLLVLTELFSLGRTAEALRTKIDQKSAISLQRGQFDPKFQVDGVAPTNHSFSENQVDLSCGINIWTDISSVLSSNLGLRLKAVFCFGGSSYDWPNVPSLQR